MSRFATPAAEESVACNLIPMIDIMFLLLLFFMLGADMSQHEIGNVILANANMVKENPKTKGQDQKISNINLCHLGDKEVACPAYKAGAVCREEKHWQILHFGQDFTSKKAIVDRLKMLADDSREPLTPGQKPPGLSGRLIMIRADKLAPYGLVQRVMEACSANGLYKMELAAAQPPKEK
jgi:biopolymer transport protein ExbD